MFSEKWGWPSFLWLIGGVWCVVCAAQAQCQQGWRENEGTCYFFSSEEKTWHDAEKYCLDRHGHLLSIRDIHEMVRVTGTRPMGFFLFFLLHVLSSWSMWHVSFPPFIFMVKKNPAVAEDASRFWNLLDWSDWPDQGKYLGVERRVHLLWVPIVRATRNYPNARGFYCIWKTINQKINHGKLYFPCLLPETGWRASRTTSTMRTVWCWWDTAMASGETRSVTPIGNSSASTPMVSWWQSSSVSQC